MAKIATLHAREILDSRGNPTVSVEVPRTVTRLIGNRAWIISDEMSMNILTSPSAQTPRGMLFHAVIA